MVVIIGQELIRSLWSLQIIYSLFVVAQQLTIHFTHNNGIIVAKLGECIALWGEPNELSIQHRIYIFIQYV